MLFITKDNIKKDKVYECAIRVSADLIIDEDELSAILGVDINNIDYISLDSIEGGRVFTLFAIMYYLRANFRMEGRNLPAEWLRNKNRAFNEGEPLAYILNHKYGLEDVLCYLR